MKYIKCVRIVIFIFSLLSLSILFAQKKSVKKIDKSMLCVGNYQTEEEAKQQLERFANTYSNREQWEERAKRIREGILKGAELFPIPEHEWVNPIYRNERSYGDYSVVNVAYESVEGVFVTASIYKPTKIEGKVPGILCPHGHWNQEGDYGRYRSDMQKRCATLARMGAVVLSYDMVGYGELREVGWVHDHPKTLKLQLLNSIRGVDLLYELEEVDKEMIAITGASGGGTQSFLLAAVDDRIKVSVPVVQVSAHFFGGCVCESGMPIHKSKNHETNNAEIAALFAPKPQLIISDGEDWTKNVPNVEYPYIKNVYKLYKKEDNVKNAHFADEGHDYGYSKRKAMYFFMAEHLGLDIKKVLKDDGEIDESLVVIEESYKMHVFNSLFPIPLTIVKSNDKAFNYDITQSPVRYITTDFENGSHLNWEKSSDGVIYINLTYQHQRDNFNRASIHWHFLIEAEPGSDIPIVIRNFNSIYNGVAYYQINNEKYCVVSNDGKNWRHPEVEIVDNNRFKLKLHMETDSLYVASVEPYRVSDLNKMILRIKDNKRIKIAKIGESVEGRDLHIIHIGNENAPHSVFIRARVHPWESGGNWVVEGLIDELLQETHEVNKYLDNYSVYILPMANIDGVARGLVRYNMKGFDLNRKLDKPADPVIAQENYYMEKWFNEMGKKGKLPEFAIDLHNDSFGQMIISPPTINTEKYLSHMDVFAEYLRKYSWFREGVLKGSPSHNISERFGFDWMVLELNANWIEGLQKKPLSTDWKLFGKQLCKVFDEYFEIIK